MSPLVVFSAFLASGVEWVEAFTIVLAVGLFRGWRPALVGTGLAAVALAAIVVGLGAAVTSFPVGVAEVVVGVFLLLFGLRWLHKAILRAGGLKALSDEAEKFDATREALSSRDLWLAVGTAFNGVLLEGLEVVLIVVALGGVGHRLGASVGAAAALVAVILLGVVLRAPLTRVPENLLKMVVGVMLTSFGTFFTGEGIGVHWWHDDLSLLALVVGYALLAFALVSWLRAGRQVALPDAPPVRLARAVVAEVWGLVVGGGSLALAALAAVLGAALFAARVDSGRGWAAVLLVAAIVGAVLLAVAESARSRD
jgi:Ca2+/H+ antiporter, TMEM165/GDT1 family